MISKQQLMALAAELQLQAHVVEKDYAPGWFLAGIAAHPGIGPGWVFKGAACLKKCYFETYRFSEDLDFTLQDAEHLDEAFLAGVFEVRAYFSVDLDAVGPMVEQDLPALRANVQGILGRGAAAAG